MKPAGQINRRSFFAGLAAYVPELRLALAEEELPPVRAAIAPDFRRLNDCRPGYGYAGIPDPNRALRAPEDAGLWQMDMRTGKRKLLITFAQAAQLPFQEKSRPVHSDPAKAKHWFNHLLYAPGSRRMALRPGPAL